MFWAYGTKSFQKQRTPVKIQRETQRSVFEKIRKDHAQNLTVGLRPTANLKKWIQASGTYQKWGPFQIKSLSPIFIMHPFSVNKNGRGKASQMNPNRNHSEPLPLPPITTTSPILSYFGFSDQPTRSSSWNTLKPLRRQLLPHSSFFDLIHSYILS